MRFLLAGGKIYPIKTKNTAAITEEPIKYGRDKRQRLTPLPKIGIISLRLAIFEVKKITDKNTNNGNTMER